jgi:hypothetical protein
MSDGGDMVRSSVGCFGLIGIITYVTLILSLNSETIVEKNKEKIYSIIPPPDV